ncbi:unnamed protein product [Closterium sp. NIES-54]
MAGLEKRGGRGAGGSGEAQAQGQPHDSAMAPMQPSLGPPRDEPRVFGLDKFNGDNFAEWSFKMENIFDHYDLLEVMEGTEKCPENDPQKSPELSESNGREKYERRGGGAGGAGGAGEGEGGGRGDGGYGSDNKSYGRGRGRFDGECHYCHKSGHMWRDCYKLPDGWTPDQGQEGRGAGGGRGRGRGGRGGRGGGAASMKSAGNESESRDDRFPGQFFFVSTQAPAGPEKDEGFEEPAAVGKVTLHSLDYWVIDSGAIYSMTPRADLLTELEPSPVKHVTLTLGQRAEVKGMGKTMFKGADGKMVGLKNNEMVAGIRVKGEPDEVLGCPTCMQAKFTRYPFSCSEATAKAPLDEVVMDVVGPLKLGATGAEYFLTIVDVYTHMTWVYVLSKKSDVAETVKTDWLPMVERQQDRLVKAIRTDRGGEFLSKEFSLWLKKNGIRHSLTMPYSPAMNGIAERANRTITETARGLLIEAGLPEYFWPDAVMLKLQDKFKCKALGDVSFYLGLHIERDVEKRCMRVHQQKYLEALVAKFGQSEGHVATPFPSGFKCVKGPEEESVGEEERRRFHSLVGSLMYAAINTRPDVAFATGQLARVVKFPNEEQVAAGMRVAKYLGQTPTVGLQYSAAAQRRQKGADGVEPGRLFLTAFSDASYASEPEDMTSVGGFICCVGGGPTAWESKK